MIAAPGEAARPALALVNTRRNDHGAPVDDLATTADVRMWLARHGLAPDARVDDAALVAIRELRDAVRELLEARIDRRAPDQAAVETVNAATTAAPMVRLLTWTSPGDPRQESHYPGVAGIPLARARLASDAIDLVTGSTHNDLLTCAAPGCMRLLLRDHPRRRWCSTRCGDRVRANRYYHRHRDAAG